MLYDQFILEMDNITTNLLNSEPTIENANLALDTMEDLQRRDPDFFAHFAKVLREGKPNPLSRLETARLFYAENVELLRGAAYDAYPEAHPADIDWVVSKLHRHLDAYRGSKIEGEFLNWAIRFVRREADTLRRFHQMYGEARLVVLEAIWSVLRGCSDLMDASTVNDIESQVREWLWQDHASPLYAEGSASVSTRLYKKARWLARAWKTAKLREHARLEPLENYKEQPFAIGARKPAAE